MAATDVTPASRAPLGELRFNRPLVAYDGTDSADLALSAAVTGARRDPQTLQDEADADARRRLDNAVACIPRDIPMTTRIRRGRAGKEIVAQSVVVAHVPSGRQPVASWS
jgi:hypothetical protein